MQQSAVLANMGRFLLQSFALNINRQTISKAFSIANINISVRVAFTKDYGIIWEFFPTYGGGGIIGQFDTADNLTLQTIWHHGQFDTADQFDTAYNSTPRTSWHRRQFDTADNLTLQTIWHRGQFDTADNLTYLICLILKLWKAFFSSSWCVWAKRSQDALNWTQTWKCLKNTNIPFAWTHCKYFTHPLHSTKVQFIR